MQKFWVNKYADAAVSALQPAIADRHHLCPPNIRVVLDKELDAKMPERWAVCWTDRWDVKLLWRSVRRLGVQNFLLLPQPEEFAFPNAGLWGVVNPNSDWLALRSEIRSKALSCLHRMQNAAPTAAVPRFFCQVCNEFAFFARRRTCNCAANRTIEEWHRDEEWCKDYWSLPLGRLIFLVRGDDPCDSSGKSWRHFLDHFLDWCCYSGVGWECMQFAPIDGDGVIFGLASREGAELLLVNGKHSLQARLIGRLVRIDSPVVQRLLADSPHQDQFQTQLYLVNLPASE